MSKQPDEKPEVLSITDVPEGHSDEMHRRMVKYTVAMSIRLACLLLFFFIDSWVRWFFVGGAVFLPWIAVLIANGGSDKSNLKPSSALLDHAPHGQLEAPSPAAGGQDDVITGEIVPDEEQAGSAARAGAGHPPQAAGPAGPSAPPADQGPSATGPLPWHGDNAHAEPAAFGGNLSPVAKRRKRQSAA